jgi:hypothetical protein
MTYPQVGKGVSAIPSPFGDAKEGLWDHDLDKCVLGNCMKCVFERHSIAFWHYDIFLPRNPATEAFE